MVIYDSLTYIERIEELDRQYQENDKRRPKEYQGIDWFLKLDIYEQRIQVQDYAWSNDFIVKIFPKVKRQVRDIIITRQSLTREGFKKLNKSFSFNTSRFVVLGILFP